MSAITDPNAKTPSLRHDGSIHDVHAKVPDDDELRRQNEELRDRLKRLEQTVTANRSGSV